MKTNLKTGKINLVKALVFGIKVAAAELDSWSLATFFLFYPSTCSSVYFITFLCTASVRSASSFIVISWNPKT